MQIKSILRREENTGGITAQMDLEIDYSSTYSTRMIAKGCARLGNSNITDMHPDTTRACITENDSNND